MTYENEKFGSDTIFVVTHQGSPYLYTQNEETFNINKDFIDLMRTKEKEMAHFLLTYYNYPISQTYSNLHKICKIKELQFSDSM